jgi:multisubunit Na+/H+ antiporter MnhG subunit
MKKILGVALILVGVVVVIISIMGLVKAFDVFNTLGAGTESIGYVFGSIVFPLLATVIGRWIIRKGFKFLREKKPSA